MPATTVDIPSAAEPLAAAGPSKAKHLRLENGVYVPTLAFFTESDEIDVAAFERHIIRLVNAGVSGILVHGSNGEAVHLSREERASMIRAARDAILQETNEKLIPLLAGCGAQSTKETIELCIDAARAGATHALILPPGYFNGLISSKLIVQYFHDVADRSPIPVLIYNYPAAASGRDLNSDEILEIAQHPNVLGVKLTCGNTGKLARVAADCPEGFFVAGGSADFILQGQVAGAHGTISGLANLCPRACLKILELSERGLMREAREMQAVVAKADWVAIQTGFVGLKGAMGYFEGYGGHPRKPCMAPTEKELDVIVSGFQPVMDLEAKL